VGKLVVTQLTAFCTHMGSHGRQNVRLGAMTTCTIWCHYWFCQGSDTRVYITEYPKTQWVLFGEPTLKLTNKSHPLTSVQCYFPMPLTMKNCSKILYKN